MDKNLSISILDANAILNRLLIGHDLKVGDWGAESALAKAIGITPTLLGSWRRRNSIADHEKVIVAAHLQDLNLNWLYFDEQPMRFAAGPNVPDEDLGVAVIGKFSNEALLRVVAERLGVQSPREEQRDEGTR